MKFSYVAFALALLQGSYGFAPISPGSKLVGHSASSLQMSFVSDLLSDRDPNQEAELEEIISNFEKELPPETTEESPEVVFKVPTKEQTGVEPHITRLAATFSCQCYEILLGKTRQAFDLSTKDHKVDIVLTDRQGFREATNPTFGAAVVGDTMILAWRGTQPGQTPIDAISDLAFAPITIPALGKHAKTVRMHMGLSSLAASDIAYNQQEIIDECKKRGIKNIVCTGHSLGGAIGQIAHIIIRAQMKDEHSPWHELKDRVQIQSLAFSAPMTLQITEEGMSEACQDFIDEIDEYSSNVVYHNDIVPRCYGFGSYMSAAIDDYASCVGQMLLDGQRFPFRGTKFLIDRVAVQVASTAEKSAMAKDLVGVWSNYVHPGTVVSYESFKAFPKTLKDYGAFHKNTGGKDTFRSVTYDPVGRGHNAILEISENHSSPWIGMKYSDDKLS